MSDELSANGKQFSYGGQAVIEGVLMRGAHTAAVACRNPQGQIVIHETPLNQKVYRGRIAKTPFVRGLVLLWDAMGLGTRALMWSADVAVAEEDDEQPLFDGPLGWGTLAVSFTLAIGLFFLLPLFASRGIEAGLNQVLGPSEAVVVESTTSAPGTENLTVEPDQQIEQTSDRSSFGRAVLANVLEGIVRLIIVIAYIWAIGRIPDVKRLFGYHGAEHKTINAYEAGAELTPEVVQQYPIEHPRCGTAFLLNVVVVSILVFALMGNPPGVAGFIFLVVTRIVFIPVIAGIAYEWLRWTAKNAHRPWVAAMIKPNLALQHLTTNEPDLGMVETAIVAFKRVLVSEDVISEDEAQIPEPRPEMAHVISG
ncbi:MAG: DUF1385 domain-containing protein [Chloroflexota bacterium]